VKFLSSSKSRGPAENRLRRTGVLFCAALVLCASMITDADARRLGGGRSIGRQSGMVQQHQAAPMAPSQTYQQRSAQPAPAAPVPAGPQRSRWLGPLAGIAAGLGIGALLSHFGMGGAFAGMFGNLLLIVAVAFIGMWLIRKFAGRRETVGSGGLRRDGREPGFATPTGWPGAGREQAQPVYDAPRGTPGAALEAVEPRVSTWVPAGFDTDTFLRHAKVNFVRLQAAWDAGDINDIREFTTNEMYAELKTDLSERSASTNRTDVVKLDATLLGIEDKPGENVASVRFEGLVRENEGAAAEPFVEVWNLVRSKQGNSGWLLAGVQQLG
jgi:predicted lipid-binding transport protein (Tim44 family)